MSLPIKPRKPSSPPVSTPPKPTPEKPAPPVSPALSQWLAKNIEVDAKPKPPAPPAPAKPTASADQLERQLAQSQPSVTPPRAAASTTWAHAGTGLSAPSAPSAYKTETTSYHEDGITFHTTTSTGPKGASSSEVSFEFRGTSYEQTTTQANGNTSVRSVSENEDRRIEKSNEIRTLPGDITDYLPADQVNQVQLDGETVGPTRQITSSTSVTDKGLTPPVTVETQSSLAYSQKVAPADGLEPGQTTVLETNMGPSASWADLPGGNYDAELSGRFVTYTQETHLDPVDGQNRSSSSLTSEARVVGQGQDGHPIRISSAVTQHTDPSGEQTRILSEVRQGSIAREDAENSFYDLMQSNDPELAEKMAQTQSAWLDFRSTTEYKDGQPGINTREFGELDRGNQDSQSVVAVSDGVNYQSLTYRNVTEQGQRVQTQTKIPDTNYNALTDTHYGPNGTYQSEQQVYAGDTLISSNDSQRQLLYPAGSALPEKGPSGYDPAAWATFRQQNPQGPVYFDQIKQFSLAQDGVETRVDSTSFHGRGATMAKVNQQVGDEQTRFEFSRSPGQGAQLQLDGHLLVQASDGGWSLDGQTLAVQADFGSKVANEIWSVAQLDEVVKNSPGVAELMPSLEKIGGALGIFSGTYSTFTADTWTDRGLGFSTALQGLGGVLAEGALKKVAGTAGASIQGVLGVKELFDTNYAEGAADLIGAGGLMVALAATGPAMPIGLTVAALAAGVRWYLDRGDDEGPPPAYSFNGSEPEWSF